jgi:hypothetical protein
VDLVDPVGGGTIFGYTDSVLPVIGAINHGGVVGEPSYQPQVLANSGISERIAAGVAGSPVVIAQQYSRAPDYSGVVAVGLNTNGGSLVGSAYTAGVTPGQQPQQTAVSVGAENERVRVPASVSTSSSVVVSSSIVPSSGHFTVSQQTQSFTAGVAPPVSSSDSRVLSTRETSVVSRPAQQRITSSEEHQAAVSSSRSVESPAMRAATGDLLSPRSAPGRGVETLSARITLDEPMGGGQRVVGSVADRQAQGRYARERAESSESRGELPKRADTPFRQTEAQTAAVRSERFMGWASERTAVVRTTGPSEGSQPLTGQGPRLSPSSSEVRSQGAARENNSPNRATGERRDPRASNTTKRVTPERVRPQSKNLPLQRASRYTDGVQTAAVQREPTRAASAVRNISETTLRRGESPPTHERAVRRAMGNQDRTSGRQDGGVNRGVTRSLRNTERRDPRTTNTTERVTPERVRPQSDKSPPQRASRNFDGVQMAAVQREPTRAASAVRKATENTMSRERSPGIQERIPRQERGNQERTGARQEARGNSIGVRESRVPPEDRRTGDRSTGRSVNTAQPDRLNKRGEVTTRSAESRMRAERITQVSRRGIQSREPLKVRAAAIRQAILERINRIVASAEQRLRRSNSTSLSAIRQLDLVTRVIEVLGEEEYEGVSELRSRGRSSSSGIRFARRRKLPKTQDVDQKKPRLKSLKALKKQRAARAAGSGMSQSGSSQSAGGVTAATGSAPRIVPGKIVSASRGGPSKSLAIFQAKSDDSEVPPSE